jgi:hypothetical protein
LVGLGHVERDATESATGDDASTSSRFRVFASHPHTRPTTLALHAAMEDSTMMDASQGLFEEQSFTLIPNGIPEDGLDKVCDAPRTSEGIIDALYSCANRSPLRVVP